MPTGYTAPIYDGEPITFPQFAARCAFAFGALIDFRDTVCTELPETIPVSGYHAEALAKAEARKAQVESWTDQQAVQEARASWSAARESVRESQAKSEERSARYLAMIAAVEGWEPPTEEHLPLKEFMLSQLRESIRFDCSYKIEEPQLLSGASYRQAEIAAADRDIAYHTEKAAEEARRHAERQAWLTALRESLAALDAAAAGLEHADA